MRGMRSVVVVILMCAVTVGCAKRPAVIEESRAGTSTIGFRDVVVEREISGEILGRRLNAPSGVAVTREGSFYVSDAGNDRIVLFTRNFVPEKATGGSGAGIGHLNRPGMLALDNQLNVVVVDAGNLRLCRFDRMLNFVNEISLRPDTNAFAFSEPSGVAVSDVGNIWLADRRQHRLAIFGITGALEKFVGGFGTAGGDFDSPEKVVVHDDELWVCDRMNGRIAIFDSFGGYDREISGEDGQLFSRPVSVAIMSDKLYWVLDASDNNVKFVWQQEERMAGGIAVPNLPIPLQQPTDIAALGEDRLLVADKGNNRILVLRVVLTEG